MIPKHNRLQSYNFFLENANILLYFNRDMTNFAKKSKKGPPIKRRSHLLFIQ